MNKKLISIVLIFMMILVTGLGAILASPDATTENVENNEQTEQSAPVTEEENKTEEESSELKVETTELNSDEPENFKASKSLEMVREPRYLGKTISQTFPDDELAKVVAETIQSHERANSGDNSIIISVDDILTQEMINFVWIINANYKNIEDLTGIGTLSNLQHLSIGGNNIKVIPSEIGNLTKLTQLQLGYNQLKSLPDEIGNLTQLEILNLYNNQLTSLPENIGNLRYLESLWLYNNSLTSLPASIGNLTNLESFRFHFNQITSLPNSFTNLNNLTELDIFNNLLPSNYNDTLNAKGMKVNGSPILYETQDKLEMINSSLTFNILNQTNIDNINLSSIVKLKSGNTLSSTHKFTFENFKDANNNAVNLSDYIQNGVVQKSGSVFVQVRANGSGLFPNNSDNAITNDTIELVFNKSLFNLYFNLNGANGNPPATQQLAAGAKATQVSITRNGYNFKGWNTVANGTGSYWDFSNTNMPANDVTLYAQWEAKPTSTPTTNSPSTPTTVNAPAQTETTAENSLFNDSDVTSTIAAAAYKNETTEKSSQTNKDIISNEINSNKTPLGTLLSREHWSLTNLIIGIFAGITSLIIFISFLAKKETNADTKQSKTWKIFSIVLGILAIIIFISTQDMSDPMVIFDLWTPLMGIIAITQIVAIVLAKSKTKKQNSQEISQNN